MGRNYLYKKDVNRRLNFWNKEILRLRYKCFLNMDNNFLPLNLKYFIFLKYLKNFYNNHTLTRVKNRCVFTNRSYAVFRTFKMSRIFLRNSLLKGNLVGFRRSSF